jgi:hypothetical protein
MSAAVRRNALALIAPYDFGFTSSLDDQETSIVALRLHHFGGITGSSR